MKKNIIIKGVLLLIVLAVLSIGFGGCGVVLCTTATVNITTPLDSWKYYIYIDGNYWGETNWYGNTTLYGVPVGYHTFYAISSDGTYWGWEYPTITCGVNNVAIYTY